MISRKVMIVNKLGLHARAAGRFVNLASTFDSDVSLIHNSTRVNGKSIMGILMLAAGKGTKLQLQIDGEDEDLAMDKLTGLIQEGFGEDE